MANNFVRFLNKLIANPLYRMRMQLSHVCFIMILFSVTSIKIARHKLLVWQNVTPVGFISYSSALTASSGSGRSLYTDLTVFSVSSEPIFSPYSKSVPFCIYQLNLGNVLEFCWVITKTLNFICCCHNTKEIFTSISLINIFLAGTNFVVLIRHSTVGAQILQQPPPLCTSPHFK